ncbi:hypothetical protein Y032_0004g1975 [Ancylostoma ceylanicum]|uniref:Uncharacterized protein n=1 Tax=Ancylostoma ceylanicum TaxID=53326 RepID=A0A016VUZ4_9BILA|nr:hypothetical protein Y032_0004g1975 [Ancylostoma ceylanicum]
MYDVVIYSRRLLSSHSTLALRTHASVWIDLRVFLDFATTAGGCHMDKVKEETPDEGGDELRLAAIHGNVTWRSIRIISTILISCIASSFRFILNWRSLGILSNEQLMQECLEVLNEDRKLEA